MTGVAMRLLLVLSLAGVVFGQMKAGNMTGMAKNMSQNGMAGDHAGHDHGADGAAGHGSSHGGGNMTGMAKNTSQNGMAGDHVGHAHGADGAAGHGSSHGGGNMTKALPVPDSCVKSPKQANCSAWDYPHANAVNDLQRLCGAMSFMSACSVAQACTRAGAGVDKPTGPGVAQVSSNNPDVCRPFNLVVSTCRLDTGMGRMAGCENFKSMCVDDSPVAKCKMSGITAIPTTKALNAQVRSICEAKPTMKGCSDCSSAWQAGKTWANCDLLATYSSLCGAEPALPQCYEYHAMCRQDPSLLFCSAYNDTAKKAADGVLKNSKPADPDAKQVAAAAASKKSGSTAAAVGGVSSVLAAASAAVLLLL